jgi:hypothetical protein
MTAEREGGFVLTADVAGFGHFVRTGTIPIPGAPFTSALQDFKAAEAHPELKDALIYALAANVSGRCVFESSQAAKIAEACFQTKLISEWRIVIPGAGVLQALFQIVQLAPGESDGTYEIAFQLAGKPEFAAAQREIAGIP